METAKPPNATGGRNADLCGYSGDSDVWRGDAAIDKRNSDTDFTGPESSDAEPVDEIMSKSASSTFPSARFPFVSYFADVNFLSWLYEDVIFLYVILVFKEFGAFLYILIWVYLIMVTQSGRLL